MSSFCRLISLASVIFLVGVCQSAHSQNSVQRRQANSRGGTTIDVKTVVADFYSYLETVPFYASSSLENELSTVNDHIKNLNNWKDRDAYIAEHRLNSYINSNRDSLKRHTEDVSKLASDFLNTKYANRTIEDRAACEDSLKSIVRERIQEREKILNRLEKEINASPESTSFNFGGLDATDILIGLAVLAFLCVIVAWVVRKGKSKPNKPRYVSPSPSSVNGNSDIVVRRKTATILRKQTLEDVIDNGAYLKIDCNEFCNDSAVRRIYIKNSCIKDIYNMYAEDLRKSDSPNENGCMVLGRWVHDTENNEYYVSLEHIVLPGDDAVFSEYELNFGGKIKLKVTEKLRKLRKETNLQYDLTCWVHSHPGLGVFFSNSDSSVQMQLKHPTHPNFLTAIVVDILTPNQDFGIFTFRQDGELNSKPDLKKLYSLKELYNWAVESERNTLNSDDYFDVLASAKSHIETCHGIHLSDSSIIDLDTLTSEQTNGLVGLIYGHSCQKDEKIEEVAVRIAKDLIPVTDDELIGCLVSAAHCSVPSVRKLVSDQLDKLKFVLVYTPSDGMLTAIPVINQELCSEQDYHGEIKFEELKIWTKRER